MQAPMRSRAVLLRSAQREKEVHAASMADLLSSIVPIPGRTTRHVGAASTNTWNFFPPMGACGTCPFHREPPMAGTSRRNPGSRHDMRIPVSKARWPWKLQKPSGTSGAHPRTMRHGSPTRKCRRTGWAGRSWSIQVRAARSHPSARRTAPRGDRTNQARPRIRQHHLRKCPKTKCIPVPQPPWHCCSRLRHAPPPVSAASRVAAA